MLKTYSILKFLFPPKHHSSMVENEAMNIDLDGDGKAISDVCYRQDSPARTIALVAEGKIVALQKLLCRNAHALEFTSEDQESLLHIAAQHNRVEILELLLKYGIDIDILDIYGRTALHTATLHNRLEAVRFLVSRGASVNILTLKCRRSPLHIAAEMDFVDCLEEILRHPLVDKDMVGHNGFVAVHFACLKDSVGALTLLMENDAKLCASDDFGQCPSHIAILNSGSKCVKKIIEYAQQKFGANASTIMNYKDSEGNVPLHTAVNSGDPEMLMLCLTFNAQIDALQDDMSTPVHYACLKGELEMLQLMFKAQPEKVRGVLAMQDKNGHTPMHKAVIFNHVDIVSYILKLYPDLEARDNQGNTSLLLAARKNSFDCLQLLLEAGAALSAEDIDQRNMVHLSVISGCTNKEQWKSAIKAEKCGALLNRKDSFGCTPLHYATQQGNIGITERLLYMGAQCRVGNNEKSTPLHFAARYGRFRTCRQLINSCPQLLNISDSQGEVPLHVASANGQVRIVKYLLEKGAVYVRARGGNTVLHFAADGGHVDVMRILLGVNPALIDSQNKDLLTPLHLAAKRGHTEAVKFLLSSGAAILLDSEQKLFINYATQAKEKEVVMATIEHDRWMEVLQSVTLKGNCPVADCIEKLPECASAALDRCIRPTEDERIVYDFHLLQISPDNIELFEKSSNRKYCHLPALNFMVTLNRVDLLSHPLCQKYLSRKWRNYGVWIHNANMLVYTLFLSVLTYFICTFPSLKHVDDSSKRHQCSLMVYKLADRHRFASTFTMPIAFISAFCIMNLLKEILQMIQQKSRYFLDMVNYLELSLYFCTILFILPFYFDYNIHFQWDIGCIAVLMAWFNFLLFFQRYDIFGIYVVMFLQISRTLFKVVSLFTILIVGFGLSFYMLLSYNPHIALDKMEYSPEVEKEFEDYFLFYEHSYGFQGVNRSSYFRNMTNYIAGCFPALYNRTADLKKDNALDAWRYPHMAVMKTLMMMLGEYDYLATFVASTEDGDPRTLHSTLLTFLILLVFILLMPILLMNLLIGLAVGDIERIQKDATLKQISMQVCWLTELESKFPKSILKRVDEMEYHEGDCCFSRCITHLKSITNFKCKQRVVTPLCKRIKKLDPRIPNPLERKATPGQVVEKLSRQVEHSQNKIKNLEVECQLQTQLLKLIIQKMNIEFEEEIDEGVDPREVEQQVVVSHSKDEKWRRNLNKLKQLTQFTGLRLRSPADHSPPPSFKKGPSKSVTTLSSHSIQDHLV